MSRRRVILGETGENLACEELARRGYAIVARRYRRRGGEIDVVALDGSTVVFIEVKTRAGGAFGGAAEAVTPGKQRRIAAVAADFLARHRLEDRACRFDVVAVDVGGDGPRIEVYRSAFDGTAAGGFRL
jgi:putative endonuclease